VGVTGHGFRIASMHLRSLERADFASVLMPYSFVLLGDDGYRADVERLLELCDERHVAVQTIKAIARRRWADGASGGRRSWYEPCEDEAALARAVRYVLSNRQLFLNTSSDARLLRPILEAAADLSAGAPSTEELEADVARLEMEPLFDGGALERI
jgi:hypothetical protein